MVVERMAVVLLETAAERMAVVLQETPVLLVENGPRVVAGKKVVDGTPMDHRIMLVESLEQPKMGSEMHLVHSSAEAQGHRKMDPDSPT